MIWLGLLAGILLGAAGWGVRGAIVLGFIGWLAGVIAKSAKAVRQPAPDTTTTATATAPRVDRMQALEIRVAALEAKLAKLEGVEMPAAIAAETPEEPVAAAAPGEVPVVAETAPIEGAEPPEPLEPPVPPQPPAPLEPPQPNPIVAWLMGGNTIARVGLVILFLGLAFLLKWAVDHAVLPPELRVGGVAVAGIALLVFGWRLRERRSGYALGLQGGGVAVLYLTTFAALRLYALVPPTLAFFMLAGIAVFSALLAVMQDALILAAFGAGGGFLAPILASTGQGSHVALFGYYLLLNLGIAGIAFAKSWRSLNIMGFLFTFVIGAMWGWRFYSPDYFATTEPFLVAFFLLYVAIVVIQALRSAPEGIPYLDGILVFGVPIAAFGLQAALLHDTEYGLAFSCIGASALYLVLAAALRHRENVRLLFECFLALGVVFATLAIPLALDARWTSALWALEGAAVVWVGLRQRRRVATGFGLLMQLLAGGMFWVGHLDMKPGVPWLDAAFLGAMLVALAGLWTSRLAGRSQWKAIDAPVPAIAFVWGFAWLLFAVDHEFRANLEPAFQPQAWVAAYAVLSASMLALSRRIAWSEAAWPSLALTPALFVLAAFTLSVNDHPFAAWGGAAWALAGAVHFWSARRHEGLVAEWLAVEHLGALLVFIAMATWDLHYWAVLETARHSAWSVASAVVPSSIALLLASAHAMDARWPVATQARSYRLHLPAVIGVAFALWVLYANATHDGSSDPLPYIPFLNALDLGHILAAIAMGSAVLAARRSGLAAPGDLRKRGPLILAALAFIWLNGVLLRTIHHWAGIPYRIDPMMRSMLVQASLSIFWSVLALVLMLHATRRGRRGIWLTGAALMGIVVVKLFVVELSHVAAVERIVSFIVVGLLMLAIGYVAPVPPRVKETQP